MKESIERFSGSGATLTVKHVGMPGNGSPHLVWGHGWGQSGSFLLPLAQSLKSFACSSVLDFPGFGDTSPPPKFWGTAEYASLVADWLVQMNVKNCVWIGHSFGCRVGLQLAYQRPSLVSGMVLISAAGLKCRRKTIRSMRVELLIRVFKAAKLILPNRQVEALRNLMGSRDYASAGPLRPILTRVVNEDLTDVARAATCPTLLIYGSNDQETPVEIGVRLQSLMANAELIVLDGYDHYSILSDGCHQVVQLIRRFIGKNFQ